MRLAGSDVVASEHPADSLLQVYITADGCYADCFSTTAGTEVTLQDFVTAFYTTWLFKAERHVLRVAAARPSSDDEARPLAEGRRESFAAWRVERRTFNQLLMCDLMGRTRSWFKVEPQQRPAANGHKTAPQSLLYFGSAITPVRDRRSGKTRLGAPYGALPGFHRLYSKALLGAARNLLEKTSGTA